MSDSTTLVESFQIYRRERLPNAKPKTISGWNNAVRLFRFSLGREPVTADLTASQIDKLQKRLYSEGYSRHTVHTTYRVLVALWRYLSDVGETAETAPQRRLDIKGRTHIRPGRPKINFDAFEAIVGLKAIRVDEVEPGEGADNQLSISLPSIDGPKGSDFDQYRREVEIVRLAERQELRRLCGTLLFGWSMLYQEWAAIEGKSRNLWRFALLRFSEYLGHPATLDDLTPENLAGVETWFSDRSKGSATAIVSKLRCVWRFAWETGAMASGPPLPGNRTWRQQRWCMHRFGRPSPAKRIGVES